jgi:hypothetical protein
VLEIEINTGANGDLLFHPAGERVRGRFDPARVAAEEIGQLVRDFPSGVPGQVVAFDPATNTGFIRDALGTAPEHTKTREAIERRAGGLSGQPARVEYPPAEKQFPNAHAGTWLGWMRRAVASGAAKVLRGKLPETDPADMRRGFYFADKTDPKDATITQLVALLTAKLSPAERKELAGVLGTK